VAIDDLAGSAGEVDKQQLTVTTRPFASRSVAFSAPTTAGTPSSRATSCTTGTLPQMFFTPSAAHWSASSAIVEHQLQRTADSGRLKDVPSVGGKTASLGELYSLLGGAFPWGKSSACSPAAGHRDRL
jgi:hypothetical protein